ncbi:MAG: WbqC family protein [Nitrospira sp.]|nr:WbqC family protein [Nitrospira sp.]
MKLAITQPNFFPWIGYFDLLMKVDKIIFLDDVLLSPRSFVVRNRVRKTSKESLWITEAVIDKTQNKRINEQYIVKDMNWLKQIRNRMLSLYNGAEYIDDAVCIINSAFELRKHSLSQFNSALIILISDYLGISFDYGFSSELPDGDFKNPQEKIIALCRKTGASEFYNFKNGIENGLYSPYEFRKYGIRLFKHDYIHPGYRQAHSPFMPYLSILDLIANEGRMSLEIINKGSNWLLMN